MHFLYSHFNAFSPLQTITGSVMNNQTGKPVPFEVKVVSNQQEAQQLAGGKGTNRTNKIIIQLL